MLDFWRGRLPLRRLAVILRHLPPTSAYWRARHGTGDWTPTEFVLADSWDLHAAANWQRAGNKHAPRPKRYPRPLEEERELAEMARRMRQFKNRGR